MDGNEERWRPYPGFAGWYEVSDWGNVASLPRSTTRGRVLDPTVNANGQRQVSLSKYGNVAVLPVSRMVLETFDRPCPPGYEARHGPGGQQDDSLPNLRWAPANSPRNQGEASPLSKLTDAIVLDSRLRFSRHEATETELAREAGVSSGTMFRAIRGYTWSHLPGAVPLPSDGRREPVTPELRAARRDYGRRGAEARWGCGKERSA